MQPVFLGSLLTTSTMVWPRQCAVGYSLLSCQALAMYCWLLSTVMTGIGSVLLAVQYCHVGHWQYTVGYSVLSYCIGSVLLATQYRHVRHWQCTVGYPVLSCQALTVYCWLAAPLCTGSVWLDSVLLAAVMTLSGIGSVLTVGCCHDTVKHWHCTVGCCHDTVRHWQCTAGCCYGSALSLLSCCMSGIGNVLLGQCTYCWLLSGIGSVLLGAVMANCTVAVMANNAQLMLWQTAQLMLRLTVHSCCGKTK